MENDAQTAALQKIAGQGAGGFLSGFTAGSLLAGIIFSLIGIAYFKYGKKEMDVPTMSAGIALMVFPYFISNTFYMILTGAGIVALHYFARKYF